MENLPSISKNPSRKILSQNRGFGVISVTKRKTLKISVTEENGLRQEFLSRRQFFSAVLSRKNGAPLIIYYYYIIIIEFHACDSVTVFFLFYFYFLKKRKKRKKEKNIGEINIYGERYRKSNFYCILVTEGKKCN